MKVGDLVRGKFLTYGWYGVVTGIHLRRGNLMYEVNFGENGTFLQRANELELLS